MSGSSNGSNPRSTRPVATLRRHAALVVATGSLLVGLLVSVGIALDGTWAEGETPTATAPPGLAELADPASPPVVTDVIGERAAELAAYLEGFAEAARNARSASSSRRPAGVVRPDDPTVWDQLAQCEAGGDWATDSAPGFSGGLGFAHGTWRANGGEEFAPIAAEATREQQIVIAERVLAGSGWGAWPGCADLLGLR